MANNVSDLRRRAGISLIKLAHQVGASPVELYRIESNKRLANILVAEAICRVLNTSIDDVFPGAKRIVTAFNQELRMPGFVSDATYARLREVGLEGDMRLHKLKIILRGHQGSMFFPIAAYEMDRLLRAVQGEDSDQSKVSFIVFDSERVRVALNLHAIMFCQFLWDVGRFEVINEGDADEESYDHPHQSGRVFFAQSSEPVILGVEPEDGRGAEGDRNYLSNIFYQLDGGGVQAHDRVYFLDEDGEDVFLRVGDISVLTAPLWVLDPEELIIDANKARKSQAPRLRAVPAGNALKEKS